MVLIIRVEKELRDLWEDPPPFCRPGASPVTDLVHWEVVIDGPDGSPYAGGTFPVDIDFVGDYPLVAPKITFKTKVYHPNINSEGEMMLESFHEKHWSAMMTMDKLLLFVVSVLYDPVLDCDPIDDDIADMYTTDLEQYEMTAMAWTWEYSSTPIVSHEVQSRSSDRPRYCYYNKDVDARCAPYERRFVEPEPSEILERRDDASLPAGGRRIVVPRETWKRVVAFLQGCTVNLPFPTFRRRFSSTLLPLSNYYSGRACF